MSRPPRLSLISHFFHSTGRMVFPSRWCRFFVVFVEDWVWRLGMGKVVAKGCPGCLSKRVMNGSTNVETKESEKGVGRSSNLWYSDARTLTVENPGVLPCSSPPRFEDRPGFSAECRSSKIQHVGLTGKAHIHADFSAHSTTVASTKTRGWGLKLLINRHCTGHVVGSID